MTPEVLKTPDAHAQLLKLLEPHGQQDLLRFWNHLEPDQQELLAAQIRAIDFTGLAKLFASGATNEDWAGLARRADDQLGAVAAAARLLTRQGRRSVVTPRR